MKDDTMDLYDLAIRKATPEEAAQLLRDTWAETERYRKAFYAAKAFIENTKAADEDRLYDEYVEASKGL